MQMAKSVSDKAFKSELEIFLLQYSFQSGLKVAEKVSADLVQYVLLEKLEQSC